MLKTLCGFILSLVLYTVTVGQVTVQLSTLPEIGDQLSYRIIPGDTTVTKIDNQVFQTGPNLQWDFSNLADGTAFTEKYDAISTGTVADSFPDADIALDFIGLAGFAKRNTTDISILGVAGDSIAGFPIPIVGLLDKPFVVRRAPFGYEDQFSTNTSSSITIDASELDTIQAFQDLVSSLPGTTVDSLRITLAVDRNENIDGWGMVTIPSGMVPVLKMTQLDNITTDIEIYAVTFAGSAWVNLSPFLPDDVKELLSVQTTNHLFFSEFKKEIVVDFTMSSDSTLLSTRYASDLKASLFGNNKFENLIDVSIYPNPSSNWVNININTEKTFNNLIVELHDISGHLIKRQSINKFTSKIDLVNFSSGSYFLSIRTEQELLYRNKVILSKSN